MSTLKASNIQPQSDSDPLVLSTNATQRLRIDTTGKVGIGTASPGSALEVQSFVSSATAGGITGTVANAGILLDVDFQAPTATRYSSGLFWRDSGLGTLPLAGIWAGDENSNGTSLLFGTSQTYGNGINKIGMTVRNGSVGIGTTGPQAPLHLYSNIDESLRIEGTSINAPVVGFYRSGTRKGYIQHSNTNLVFRTEDPSGCVAFFNYTGEVMRLDSTGYVGIGKTNPTVALDVVGAITSSGDVNITSATTSNSSLTGALKVAGGAGVAGSLYVGARATANVITTATGISFGVGSASMPVPAGDAPMFAARAWAIAINSTTHSGGNIQSYSYNASTSEYTFTFATGFADNNYSVVPFVHRTGSNSDAMATVKSRGTTSVTIATVNRDNSTLNWTNGNLAGVGFTLFY